MCQAWYTMLDTTDRYPPQTPPRFRTSLVGGHSVDVKAVMAETHSGRDNLEEALPSPVRRARGLPGGGSQRGRAVKSLTLR